jgi:cobalt/nickel transport system ATP-binding protein
MKETNPALRFRDVSFSYDDGRPVLTGVNCAIGEGERVALVGANGSGKSTLLHLAVGLLKPDDGAVEAFGRECRDEEDFFEVRRHIGLLFQEPEDQLFCPTVLEDVAFGPLNLGKELEEAYAVAHNTLDSLGLEGYGDRITYRLSEGEKRLAALAAVLSMEPELILMDEPTAGLDRDIVAHIVGILQDLSVGVVAVSHDRGFLQQVTNRTLRLRDGSVEEGALEGPHGAAATA